VNRIQYNNSLLKSNIKRLPCYSFVPSFRTPYTPQCTYPLTENPGFNHQPQSTTKTMCLKVNTIFRCNCPLQNSTCCPHHVYVRKSQTEINQGEKYVNGFHTRLESALQGRKDWTPLQTPKQQWEHCAKYKAANRETTNTGRAKVRPGKERTCKNTLQTPETFSKLVLGLCDECKEGHPPGIIILLDEELIRPKRQSSVICKGPGSLPTIWE